MLVRNSLVVVASVVVVAATGCDNLVDDEEGKVSEEEIPLERRAEIPLRAGFLDGKAVRYYWLGLFVPKETSWFPAYEKFPGMPVREMYVWPDAAGAPALEGPQRPIVDTLPRQAQSSDFFELVLVRPGPDTAADDIKSRATVLRSGFALEHTGRVVNCPLVGEKATLGGAAAGKGRRLTLWYRKKTTHCMLLDGGGSLPAPRVFSTPVAEGRSELRVAAGELYTLRSTAFTGADEVRNIPVPQNEIFRHPPGSPEYTPFLKIWDVTRPSDYQVGQIRSYADLFPVPGFTDPSITARSPEAFCNCPLVSTAD